MLQRLFMCSEITKCMTCHYDGHIKDENLRHPADAIGWNEFDIRHPDFAWNRNVLGWGN